MGIVLKNLNAISLFVISLNITDPDVISLSLRPELPLSLRWGAEGSLIQFTPLVCWNTLHVRLGPQCMGPGYICTCRSLCDPITPREVALLSWCVSYCILFVSFKYKSIRYSIIVIYLSNFFFNLTKRWMNKLWKE